MLYICGKEMVHVEKGVAGVADGDLSDYGLINQMEGV